MPKETTKTEIHLFENIALAFSGGGFRAAAFSLGVLSYLNHFRWKEKSLLERVKGLSTVSGGTITGAAYAVADAQSQPFDLFFDKMHSFLEGDEVLDAALSKMEDDSIWQGTDKKHSLINAFALAYKEKLTNEKMGLLKSGKGHLKDVCFNATEFSFGMAFRFQINGYFGNYKVDIKEEAAKHEIYIADAVASSSCFPLGFAPMIMPDDYYSHDSNEYLTLKQKEYFNEGIGIMDGGIVDNQGIGSTILADKRLDEDGYDLILVCDVASYKMDPWKKNEDAVSSGLSIKKWLSDLVKKVKSAGSKWLLLIIGLLLTGLGIQDVFPRWTALALYSGGIITFIGLALIFIKFIARSAIRLGLLAVKNRLEKLIPKFFIEKITFLDDLRFSLIKKMIEERFTSGLTMVNDVFLKQIRRLNYNLFYADEKLKNRRASAMIYQLTRDQFDDKKSTETLGDDPVPGLKLPGKKIFDVAQIASDMATTLWFTPDDTKKESLKNLIACGQFTACYTLLRYLNKLHPDCTSSRQEEIQELFSEMAKDWDQFVDNPFWIIPPTTENT